MSYCRWPDMNGTCDVHVYKSVEGYCIHIASRRGLEVDGDFLTYEFPDDCAKALRDIRSLGYSVPRYAIDALEDECREVKP